MPTKCELSKHGENMKNRHRCLKGHPVGHCDSNIRKKVCKKMGTFYEQILPSQPWGDKVVIKRDLSNCESDMIRNPELQCDEVVQSDDQLATKL